MTQRLVVRDNLKGGVTVEIVDLDRLFKDDGRPVIADVPLPEFLAWAQKRREVLSEVERENDVMAALMPGVSHGFIRLRAFVDPQSPRKPPPPEGL